MSTIPKDYEEGREAFMARIQEDKDLKVVVPAANQLQIDIDTDEQYAAFQRSLEVFNRNATVGMRITAYDEHPSRSGLPRRHITLEMSFDLTPLSRIAWQAAFGSDPVREMLSLFRLEKGDQHPTLFVERKTLADLLMEKISDPLA